jgi:predicted porin
MKKTLLSLLLLGSAAAAYAQTSVSVYGILDMGIANENKGDPGGSVTRMDSGIWSGSRLGFTGTEDLGGGLAANFKIENGFSADTGAAAQGGLLFGRQAWVGLSGSFGGVKLGRQLNPIFVALDSIDPFSTGLAGDSSRWFPAYGFRVNNTINYSTPTMKGFSGEAAYSLGEVAGSTSAGRQIGLRATYSTSPLLLVLGYHNANNATGTDSAKSTLLAGVYDFGVAKAHLAYQIDKGVGTLDTRDMLLGITVPIGPHKIVADYIRKTDKVTSNANAHQLAIAYIYVMSKRTNFYTSFARATNDSAASYNVAKPGASDRLFNFGIRHKF